MPMKPQFEYVVYKGDEIICAGTKAECAQKLGITEQSVAHLGTGAYKRSLKKRNLDEGNAMIVEKVLISEIEAEKQRSEFNLYVNLYATLTNHIRMKAEANPGVSRYIDLVNYIDKLEGGKNDV